MWKGYSFLIFFMFLNSFIKDNVDAFDNLQYWRPLRHRASRRANAIRNDTKNQNLLSRKDNTEVKLKNKDNSKLMPIERPHNIRHTNRTNIGTESVKLPKLQKRNLRQKDSSTRITKMNLMQQETETTTDAHPNDADSISHEALSPYTLKQQLTKYATKTLDANVTIELIGRSLEYNDIVMLKYTSLNQNPALRTNKDKYEEMHEKKIIFIVHGLSVMGTAHLPCLYHMYYLDYLISYYMDFLDDFDIFIVPMANPDGFLKQNKGYWNKNWSPQNACPGVSLDRNFDVAWNASHGISSCNAQYPGPAPFSEEETKAIRDVFKRHAHRMIGYFHVHSGTYNSNAFKGEAVLYPRGYTDVQTDDDIYIDMKGEIDEVMRNASFRVTSVTVDTLNSWYGKVTGTSVDYASTVYGVPYAMELVMQLYTHEPHEYQSYAMHEIWRRVIDVIFEHIADSRRKDA